MPVGVSCCLYCPHHISGTVLGTEMHRTWLLPSRSPGLAEGQTFKHLVSVPCEDLRPVLSPTADPLSEVGGEAGRQRMSSTTSQALVSTPLMAEVPGLHPEGQRGNTCRRSPGTKPAWPCSVSVHSAGVWGECSNSEEACKPAPGCSEHPGRMGPDPGVSGMGAWTWLTPQPQLWSRGEANPGWRWQVHPKQPGRLHGG